MRKSFFSMLLATCALCCASLCLAQDMDDAEDSEPQQRVAVKTISGEEMLTKDGIKLVASYYPAESEKDTIPVILLHDYQSERRALHSLAVYLQKNGYSVLVPDLRGHGDSVRQVTGKGKETKIKMGKLTAPAMKLMAEQDVEQCKRFLISENDDGKLNIQKLCIVGIGPMGCAVATGYTAYDWSWDPSQGGDVKALVLVSPKDNVNGLMMKVLVSPQLSKTLPVFIAYGDGDRTATADFNKVYKIFGKNRPDELNPNSNLSAEERTLFFSSLPTAIQGEELLGLQGNKDVKVKIAKFIDLKLGAAEIYWKLRRKN